MSLTLVFRSFLAAPAAEVWPAVTTWQGVNAELSPLRMTLPATWRGRSLADVEPGRWLFWSWVLLLGLLPLDRHHFRLESVGPGFRFQEDSTSLVCRRWRHFRSIEPADGGCLLTDRLEIKPRLALLGVLLAPVYRGVFRNRHRKLRRWYGGREG